MRFGVAALPLFRFVCQTIIVQCDELAIIFIEERHFNSKK